MKVVSATGNASWRLSGERFLVRAAGSAPNSSVTLPCAYAPLKLFVLSLFFRLAIAVHPNYGPIELPENVLTSLRTMLLTETPGTVIDFPSCLVGPAGLGHGLKTIGLGGACVYRGVSLVCIDVSGLTWFFAVGEDVQFPVSAPLAHCRVNHTTRIGVPPSDE